MQGSLAASSRRRAAGRKRRWLRRIGERGERRIRIRVAVANGVREPAALPGGRDSRRRDRPEDRAEAAGVLPAQSRPEQLVLALDVDLRDQLGLRELTA